MATLVVQERHLWLNLADMRETDKYCFLDSPISQAGLFDDTVESFAQQFSAAQKQTEAIKHTLPRQTALWEMVTAPLPLPEGSRVDNLLFPVLFVSYQPAVPKP